MRVKACLAAAGGPGTAFGKRQRDLDTVRSTAQLWGVGCLFARVTFFKVALKPVLTFLFAAFVFNISF